MLGTKTENYFIELFVRVHSLWTHWDWDLKTFLWHDICRQWVIVADKFFVAMLLFLPDISASSYLFSFSLNRSKSVSDVRKQTSSVNLLHFRNWKRSLLLQELYPSLPQIESSSWDTNCSMLIANLQTRSSLSKQG